MRRDPQFFQRNSNHPTSGQLDAGTGLELPPSAEIQAPVDADDDVPEVELPLLFMSKRLREALKLEELLTANNIDYLVEAGPYTGGLLFRRQLTGAYFYVAEADILRSRELLTANGYRPFEEP